MQKISIVFILLLLGYVNAQAQTQENSGWLASFNTFKLTEKASIHLDVQLRSNNDYENIQTMLYRTGINYKTRKNHTATVGYAFIPNRSVIAGNGKLLSEHRLWQQYVIHQPLKSTTGLTHRFRFEERFVPIAALENGEIIKDGSFMATRLRYFFRSVIPLATPAANFTKGPFAAIQNEVFVQTSAREKLNGKFFNQNRLYAAAGYRLSKKTDLEAGYLWLYTEGKSSHVNNHVAQLAIYLKL